MIKIPQKLIGRDVVEDKIINVAIQTFIQYGNQLDESNQIFKSFEKYLEDDIKKMI